MRTPAVERSELTTRPQALTSAAPASAGDELGGQRRKGAREQLLDAAECLFGRHGIEGVSLREIAVAAGQRNNSAVHYHFGDKQGLVDALIADRIGKVEQVRQALLTQAGDLGSCDMPMLLRLMWQPLLDLDAQRDGHWFIQFQLSYQIQHAGTGHPIATDPVRHPASTSILAALRAHCPQLPPEQFNYRLGLIAVMFWAAVAGHDNAAIASNQRWSTRFSLEETIKVAVASLAAPA